MQDQIIECESCLKAGIHTEATTHSQNSEFSLIEESMNPDFDLLNYLLGSYHCALDSLHGGYITKEDFDAFVDYNDLHFCANW